MSGDCFWDGHYSHRTDKCTEGWYKIHIPIKKYNDYPLDWCEKNIDGEWCFDGAFYIKNKSDAMRFKLIWG